MIKNTIRVLNKNIKYSFAGFREPPIKSQLQIVSKEPINHDSYIYKVKWKGPQFSLTIGQHFRIVETIPTYQAPEGEEVVRKYTPISPCCEKENIDLLLKIYRPNIHEKFPHGGKLTPYLQKLKIGDTINVDGPFGRFGYKSGGIVTIDGKQMPKKRIFFIAGGSGITPVYQTINQLRKMKDQNIEIILLFANKAEQDILLRKQLQAMQPRIKLFYTLCNPPLDWKGFEGFTKREMLESICPLDDPNTLYCHCGPGPMNSMIREIFAKNYPASTLFKY